LEIIEISVSPSGTLPGLGERERQARERRKPPSNAG
jgi:hypothetical protein